MQRWVVVCWALLALACADVCPDGGRCEEGQTCCNSPADGYECCPFDQGECCEDHVHCCPADTLCNMSTASCENATMSLRWRERTPAGKAAASKSFRMIRSYAGEDDDNICPDQSRCPAEFSCLKALTKYGCCPLPQGISCSDGKHCCPEGHLCSLDSRSCMKKELVTTVLCSDGVSECPDDSTCCETPDGTWGCCPMPKAVCCEDKRSCCPEGTTCDVQHMKCIASSSRKELPMWAKFPARIRADWENQNQNLKDRNNVTAKAAADTGTTAAPQVPTANRVAPSEPASSVTRRAGDIPCNASVSCPDGTTCCETTCGNWACCPYPEAVCCEDHEHCCPNGMKCNLAQQTCDGDSSSEPWSKNMPTITRKVELQEKNVSCDSTASCPDGTTCCKTKDGGWACCPYPEAVCCEDYEHCCPKGMKCNLAQQTCDGDSSSEPWSKKMPSIPRKVELQEKNVSCDSTTSCPDGTTCCKTKDGGWACCPLPQAVCCDDHEHCCPAGTTCDLTTLTCQEPSGSTAMKQKIPAFTTPSPAATQSPVTTTAITREEVKTTQKLDEGRVKCDAQTSCPQSTTCCRMESSRKWGCCPLPQAVCCTDGSHCCPTHYRCDESRTACIKEELVIPWYTKIPALTSVQDQPALIQDQDRLKQCPQHTSCCQLLTGELGCCPLENAVCCPDMEHCCPQGYTCDVASKSCHKLIQLQLETVPLTPVYQFTDTPQYQQPPPVGQNDIQCDDKFKCREDETCCKTSPSSWGCCPSPNAICCSDMKHCCPSGYSCTEEGSCIQNSRLQWHSWNVFIANKKRTLIV